MSAHTNFDDDSTAFDIGRVPEALHADDPLDQGDAYLAALSGARSTHDEAAEKFRTAPRTDVNLIDLERLFTNGNASAAVRMLQNRRNIVCGSRHIVDFDPQTMCWKTGASYLDLLVCVGRDIGLAPIIPALDAHHNFGFKLDVQQGNRQFTARHVKLGFDPAGSMMKIGRTGAGEDVWLAFVCPVALDIPEIPGSNPSSNIKKSTCLTTSQQRRAQMFLAYCLNQSSYRDVTVGQRYPDVNEENWENATNMFDRIIDLNLESLKDLDRVIASHYVGWVAGAPDHYTQDDFFTSRIPICVTSRFGQNHRVGVRPAQERLTWDADRDWSRIRYVNIALATHISARRVSEWTPVDLDHLIQSFPDGIFDSPPSDPSRNQLTREQLQQILDAPVGHILPHVYSKRGYLVITHNSTSDDLMEPYGILVKAADLHHAFAPLQIPVEVSGTQTGNPPQPGQLTDTMYAPSTATPFYFYPQAGLRTFGHFQANGLISGCYPTVARLNQRLRTHNLVQPDTGFDLSNGHAADNDMHYLTRNARIVHPIASQGYNAMMHHIRGRSSHHHDAQRGLVTAALAGQWASPAGGYARQAEELLADCHNEMPHHSFARKIAPVHLSRDLRLENVYCIDMNALHPSRQTGPVIIDDIINPLLRMWDHADTRVFLEHHVQLFHPSAYPALYSWTTYPLTSLLDLIFAKAVPLYTTDKFKHSLMVELCSVVERALNYMHTGNAAVITSSLMTPLWIGKALITDGFPCFNSRIIRLINGINLEIAAPEWPLSKDSHRPLASSKASQLYRYKDHHFNVFYAHLCMGIIISKPPPPFINETNEYRQHAYSIMGYCVALFVDDCRDLVTTNVTKEIKHQRRLASPYPDYAELRAESLRRWRSTSEPLSYGGLQAPTYGALLQSVCENPKGKVPANIAASECLSYRALAKRIISGVTATRALPAPLWKDGSFQTALIIAIEEIKRMLNIADTDSAEVVIDMLATTLRGFHIDFVPWHAPSESANSTCTVVSHLHWISIDRTTHVGGASSPSNPLIDQMTEIERAAVSTAANDRTLAWSVPARLSHMQTLWNKSVLPVEWNQAHATLKEMHGKESHRYVVDTYDWAERNYNRNDWRHHMALVWAILLTAIIPRLHVPDEAKAAARSLKSPEDINRTIRNWPWVKHTSTKRGLTRPEPYITMMTTYIMAILDNTSPLLRSVGTHNGFGNPWTTKHNPKYIHAVTMIRMGIAVAKTGGVCKSPKFGENFAIRPEPELEALYHCVMNHLQGGQYGVYFAIQEIFGQTMADEIVMEGHGERPTVHSTREA